MNLKIENPCTENWGGMTPDAVGRHCAVCAKSVHDFTDKPREELLTFLLCSTSSPCVRMLASQEQFTPEEVQVVAQKIVRSGKVLSAAALALVTLFATGCQSETGNGTPTVATPTSGMVVAAVPVDTPRQADTVVEPMILGRMLPPKAACVPVTSVPEPVVMGEAPVLMGAPPPIPEVLGFDTSTVPAEK